jgi:hypothetical protein
MVKLAASYNQRGAGVAVSRRQYSGWEALVWVPMKTIPDRKDRALRALARAEWIK